MSPLDSFLIYVQKPSLLICPSWPQRILSPPYFNKNFILCYPIFFSLIISFPQTAVLRNCLLFKLHLVITHSLFFNLFPPQFCQETFSLRVVTRQGRNFLTLCWLFCTVLDLVSPVPIQFTHFWQINLSNLSNV